MDEGVYVNGRVNVDEGVSVDGGVNVDGGAGAYKNMVDGGGMYATDPKSQPRPLQYCFPCRQIGGIWFCGGFFGQGPTIALSGATNDCENGGPPSLGKGVGNVGLDVVVGGLAVGVSFRSGVFLAVVVISKSMGGRFRLVLLFGTQAWTWLDLLAGHRPNRWWWWWRFGLVVGGGVVSTCRW